MGFFDKLFRKEERSDFSQSSMPAVNQVAAETVLLMSTDTRARLDAVNALGMTNSPRVVPTLAKTLREDKTERIRSMCVGYLGSIKGDQAEVALLEVTGDPSPYVRRRVIEGLFRIGSERGLEAVRAALDDGDPIVKAKAKLFTAKMASPIEDMNCPHLTKFGMCEMPGCEFNECDWETENKGRYKKCPRFKKD
ncbi:MAG: HEAT repeat domain-containing protein [Candidatus Krumholzibacteria bacterium]|nr:HEAT repeat domain-containing protein [Candidatus Krumholzibacteria bacterium]